MQQSTHSLTCFVPTHRRPAFLRRLLHFYRECPPDFDFVVVDSSDEPAATENARTIREASDNGLRATHRRIDLDFVTKVRVALGESSSRFAMLCADDDILFPAACRRCADFLEQNPGYVSAQGGTALIYPGRSFFAVMRLKGFDVDDDDPFARCQRSAASFFSNFYSVYRREDLRRNFALTEAAVDARLSYTLPEMLLSQLSLIQGKVKVLPVMHLLMERHQRNAGFLGRAGERMRAEEMYQRFRSCLVVELAGKGVGEALAGAFVDEAYGYFREISLKHRKRKRSFGVMLSGFFRSMVERAEDAYRCDRARHRRILRPGDIAGSEREWQIAVRLMREFPDGMPG